MNFFPRNVLKKICRARLGRAQPSQAAGPPAVSFPATTHATARCPWRVREPRCPVPQAAEPPPLEIDPPACSGRAAARAGSARRRGRGPSPPRAGAAGGGHTPRVGGYSGLGKGAPGRRGRPGLGLRRRARPGLQEGDGDAGWAGLARLGLSPVGRGDFCFFK